MMRKTCRDFSQWTSASGIPHIGRAQSSCMRVFWVIIFLGCLVMFVYQMIVLVQSYLEYNVIVKTDLKFETLPFPAVTICNLNPLKKSEVMKNANLSAMMNAYQQAIDGKLTGKDDFLFLKCNDSMAMQSHARDCLVYLTAKMTDEDRKKMGYSQSEFIQTCSFDLQNCIDSFDEMLDPTYGMCYTFNAHRPPRFYSTRAGPAYGLRIMLFSQLSDYLDITEAAGVRVTVSGQDEKVFPDAFGYNAASGFTTSFGLQYIETNRLGPPFGNCTSLNSTVYSVEGCFRECLQKYLYKKCGCCDPSFDLIPGCTYCDISSISCINSATDGGGGANDTGFNAATECPCNQLCQEATYTMTVSTANWPALNYKPKCNLPGVDFVDQTCSEWYNDNSMMVEVFYERMNYQSLTESEAYGLVSLISDFGGQIGLWIGVSAITMVEFVFFPFLAFYSCCTRPSTKVKTMSGEDYDEDDNLFDKVGGGNEPPPPYPGPPNHYDGKQPFKNDLHQTNPYSQGKEFEMPPPIVH